jgi:hypothetical protein
VAKIHTIARAKRIFFIISPCAAGCGNNTVQVYARHRIAIESAVVSCVMFVSAATKRENFLFCKISLARIPRKMPCVYRVKKLYR